MLRHTEFEGVAATEAHGLISDMTGEGFDPYRAWLNIRDVRRPLNAYQLLGLAAAEGDLDRIRRAASQQRAAMEMHRFEAHPATWRAVRDELEQAIQTLTDADLKVAYDITLRHGGDPEPTLRPENGNGASRAPAALLRCAQCGSDNPSTRKFCGSCGHNLWETCPSCGTLSLAGERYCGACGVHLSSHIRQLVEQYEANLAKAQSLHQEFRYEEALALLTTMLAVEHSYLAEPMRRAKQLQEEVSRDRDLRLAQIQTALDQANAAAEGCDFAAALALLEPIPAALRSPEMETLYRDMRAKASELALLEESLEEAVRQKNSTEVLASVRQVLKIKPDHARALKLARHLAQSVGRVAADRLARHRYEDACRLLQQLPEEVLSEQLAELSQRATELLWLMQHLRSAPYADAPLLAIAGRLRKMAPADPQAARWYDEIQRRVAAGSRQSKFSVPTMIRAPENNHCGLPVDWLTGFRRVDDSRVRESAAFVEHPGNYYVSAGLALHGLGLAGLRINLLPDDGGVWGRLSRVLPRRSSGVAWGLDLGCGALKAVRLALDDKQKSPAITACDYQEYRKVLSQANDEAEAQTLVQEALQAFAARHRLRGERVCLGLPPAMVLSRMLTMPVISPEKLEVAVRYEARRQFPHLHGELVLGHHAMEKIEGDLHVRRESEVLMVVTRRARLEVLLKACQELGISVESVQADFLALHNFLLLDHLPEQVQDVALPSAVMPALAVLDIGADSSNLVVSSAKLAWHRNIPLGTERFTKTLVREFDLSFAEAEKLLRNPDAAPSLHKFYSALQPACEDFVEEIQRTLEGFRRIHHKQRVEMLLGLGGGFQLHGLMKYLRYGPQPLDRRPNGDRILTATAPA